MKKKIRQAFEQVFYVVWFMRIPIVSVSVLLLMCACKLSDMSNTICVCVSVCFMLSAGYIINDILDIEIDKISAPNRPLPSGRISMNFAKKLCFILVVLASIFSLLTKNVMFVSYIMFYEMMFLIYTKFLKKNGLVKNLVTALFFSSIAFVPALFKTAVFFNIFPLIVISFIFTFGRELLMDVRDTEGDMVIKGRKRMDRRYALLFSTFFIICSFVFMEIVYLNRLYILRYFIIVFFSILFYLCMRTTQKNIWLSTEITKIIFLINLLFLYFGIG